SRYDVCAWPRLIDPMLDILLDRHEDDAVVFTLRAAPMVTSRSRAMARGPWHWHSLSTGGLLLGTLFFAASLTPSLLPRTSLTQGVLAGCSLAAGYGIGAFAGWLWTYIELVRPDGRFLRVARLVAASGCAIVVIISLRHAAGWQNSIRELMGLAPV